MLEFTRRDFLKLSIAGGASVFLGSIAPGRAAERGISVNRSTGKRRLSLPTTCGLCSAGCGLLGFLEGDVLVKLQGNPEHPLNKGAICAKGASCLNILYDPDRLVIPVKQTGERGSARWQRSTWDEAMRITARTLSELRRSGATEKFVFYAGRREFLTERFLKSVGRTVAFFAEEDLMRNRLAASRATWGYAAGIPDIERSRLIINFGSDFLRWHPYFVPLCRRYSTAKMKGARLVTIDSRYSDTAASSDEFHLINPGTYGLIALAMAGVIVEEGLIDKRFIDKYTNSSCGELASILRRYTVEWAEEESGMPAEDIRRLALEFAKAPFAVAMSGDSAAWNTNGAETERSVLLLNAVTGRIDSPGGLCPPLVKPVDVPVGPPPTGEITDPGVSFFSFLETAAASGEQIELLLIYKTNPVYSSPGGDWIEAVLKDREKIKKLIVVDTHLTETGLLADMVLPAATFLETWGLFSSHAFNKVPCLSMRRPMVAMIGETEVLRSHRGPAREKMEPRMRPLGEAMGLDDFFLEVARRIGDDVSVYLPFSSSEQAVKAAALRIEGEQGEEIFEHLRRRGFWCNFKEKENYRSYEVRGFPTASGRFQIKLAGGGFHKFPAFSTIKKTTAERSDLLNMVIYDNGLIDEQTANIKWLAEICHANPLWMNPVDAGARGIKDGDRVKITSDVWAVEVTVFVTPGVRKGVVCLAMGLGHWATGRIARAIKYESDDPDTALLWWHDDGAGINAERLVPLALDPAGGGVAYNCGVVGVSKLQGKSGGS